MKRYLKKQITQTLLIATAAVFSLSVVNAQAKPTLTVGFTTDGLHSLKAGSDELLSSGAFQANTVILKSIGGKITNGAIIGGLTVDVPARRIIRTYAWGVITCTYIPHADRLNLDVTVENRSDKIIDGLTLQMLALKFPQAAKFEDYTRDSSNVDKPTVVGVDYGTGTLAVANEDIGRPLYAGLPTGSEKDPNAVYPFLVSNFRDPIFPIGWLDSPKISRPIYPGDTDRWHLSVRVGPAGQSPRDLATDVYQKYGAAYQFELNWADRRPIAYLNLGKTVPHPDNGTNPRGWFYNDPTIDVTTDAGRKVFETRTLQKVDDTIKNAKAANAQGIIVWDIEGQEFPHAMSYIGDPRHRPTETDAFADTIFKKIKDAGFRTGVCLRPQLPMRTIYGDVPEQVEVRDQTFNLQEKIDYAKKQWGCTLFYVDSNCYHDPRMDPSDGKSYELASADVFQTIAEAYPDTLFIPEQVITRYYAYTAPYRELNNGLYGTSADVQRVYPAGVSVININVNDAQRLVEYHDRLVAAVKHGDILLFRSWPHDPVWPEQQAVLDIYKESGK